MGDDIRPKGWSSTRLAGLLMAGRGRPLAFVLLVLLILFGLGPTGSFWRPIRSLVFDAYQRAFPRSIDRLPVVIVDIDEASLKELGQWPWPRTRLASLIQAVHDLGALAVGLDFIMPEADRLSPGVFARERKDIDPSLRDAMLSLPSNDVILAGVMAGAPTVVGRAGVYHSSESDVPVDWQTSVMVGPDVSLNAVTGYSGHLCNLAEIEDAASGHGYLNAYHDPDGVVRMAPLVVSVDGYLAPTLPLELLRVATGQDWYSLVGGPEGIRGIELGDFFIPTDPGGRFRIYYSSVDPRRRVSARDVLAGRVNEKAVAGKAAIIGVSALGLVDTATVPVASLMNGTEIHTQVVENINQGLRLIRSPRAKLIELLGLAAAGLILILATPLGRDFFSLALFILLSAAFITAGLFGFIHYHLLYDPSLPIAGSAIMLLELLTARYAAIDSKRRELKAALEAERVSRIRMAGELDAARSIQMGMLPDPKTIPGLPGRIDFHAFLEPAGSVGGDLYDALMIDENHFFFLIGDVAGKGIPASLFMALGKTLTKSLAMRGGALLDDLVARANEEISRENPADLFITAVACILDVTTGQLEICVAGHDAPILLRRGLAPSTLDSPGGPPLCILEDFPYPVSSFQLLPGDMVIMITDGVTEAHNRDNEMYGHQRAMAYLEAELNKGIGNLEAESICQGLYEDVMRFTDQADAFDDITIVAVGFNGPDQDQGNRV